MYSSQSLLNLGQILKKQRENQGLSLKTISEQTKIGVQILQAIEEAQIDQLPVYAYLRGFILTYAKVLEIDEKTIEKELKTLIPQTENSSSGVNASSSVENFIEKDLRLAPVILAISILFVLGGILVFTNIVRSYKRKLIGVELTNTEKELVTDKPLLNSMENKSKNRSEKSKKKEKARADGPDREQTKSRLFEEKKKKQEKKSESPDREQTKSRLFKEKKKKQEKKLESPPREKKPKPSSGELEVIVKALGDVTVLYQVDEEKKLEVSLKEDQFEVLKGKENILIQTEASDLIYIFYNGANQGLFGSGGKKEKIFSRRKEN